MPTAVAIAAGSNLGNRALYLRRAIHELRRVVRVVRISSIIETAAVDAPAGSPDFLNLVVAGHTALSPKDLMQALLDIEARLGRRRPSQRNAPRTIDLDLIFYDAVRMQTRELTLPHPRFAEREFVMKPLREVWLAQRVPKPPPRVT